MTHTTVKQAVLAAKNDFLEAYGTDYSVGQFNFGVVEGDADNYKYIAEFATGAGYISSDMYTWRSNQDAQDLFDSIDGLDDAAVEQLVDVQLAIGFLIEDAGYTTEVQ